MKLLFYTDVHAADQTPRSRTGSYKDDILAKLEEIISLANSLGVDFLLNGADTFDRKSAWRVSHRLVQDMIKIMREFDGARHFTCVGTHDVPTGRLDKLDQQPLGVLEEAGVITVLGAPREHDVINLGQSQTGHVYLHVVPASYDLDKNPENYAVRFGEKQGLLGGPRSPSQDLDTIITMAHGMITMPGQGFFGDFTCSERLAPLTDANLVLYGHPHTPDGVYTVGTTIFCGPGAVCRRDSSSYNRNRLPQVALVEITDKIDVTLITLKSARLGPDVFQTVIQDELDENQQQAHLDSFVASLAGAKISDDVWGLEALLDEVRAANVSQQTKELALEILERVAE